METIKLSVPDMKSPHCMMTVRNAIRNLNGAEIVNISPGYCEVNISGTITQQHVVDVVTRAGYNVDTK